MATAAPPAKRKVRAPRFGLAIPSWVWYLLFFLIPLGVIVFYSFGYKPPVNSGRGAIATDQLSLQNYRDALSDTFFSIFRNTLQIAVTGTVLCLLIGFPVAYFIAVKVKERWRGLLLGLIIVPFWTSFLIRTIAWRIVLGPKGLFSNWLMDVGIRDTPIRILDTRFAVQIGVVYNYLPLMIFPLFVALDRLDPALREASKDLGAGRVRTFFQVTLPLAMPGMVAGLLLVFIPLAGDYITAYVLGGAKGTMVGALVASQFQAAQNWALGSAMAVVLIGVIMGTIAIVAGVSLVIRTILRRNRAVDLDLVPPARPGTPLPPPVGAPA